MKLVIGNKRYSSWSLRPWLLLKYYDISFQEILIKLYEPGSPAEIKKYSAAAKVPVLIDDSITVWESMAIFEYLNEKYADKKMWPNEVAERAHARSICNEMHAGFSHMREIMSHNVRDHFPDFDYSGAKADVERIKEIWKDCLKKYGGPYLFGNFTIADAMFAPVVNRFVTYDVKCDDLILDYIKTIRDIPAHKEWINSGMTEV